MQLDKFLITNELFYKNIDSNIAYARDCGVSKIYLREFELLRFYKFLDACSIYDILLFVNYINDYKNDIERYADGIHLKSCDLDLRGILSKQKLVSYSAHSLNDVINAYNKGIDYIMLSPAFFVDGKNPPLGIEYFRNLPLQYKARIYALGGINFDNINKFYDIGIRGVAGIRMFLKA